MRNAGRQANEPQVAFDASRSADGAESEVLGEPGGLAHTDSDGFAVQEAARIAGPGFERVAEGVAEIEQHPVAGLGLVTLDDACLGGDADDDRLGEEGGIVAEHALPMAFQPGEEGGVAEQPVLGDFGVTRAHFAGGQSGQRSGVGED